MAFLNQSYRKNITCPTPENGFNKYGIPVEKLTMKFVYRKCIRFSVHL